MFSKLLEKSRVFLIKARSNKHVKYGLPFIFFILFGVVGLREFQTVRYDFKRSKTFNPNEAKEYGLKMKKPETIEETFSRLKDLDLDNWENIRGPKFLYDNEGRRSIVKMELICTAQNYHWGKLGKSSLVGKIACANSGADVAENQPYAEFWMGTHPNGPSYIKTTKVELSQYLNLHSNELGAEVISQFGVQLPYLFKVLSVEKPLSIQAHPTKPHAEELFHKFPKIYKDGNHKPELAIAVTKFEALCGFRPLSEIKHFLRNVVEFEMLIDLKNLKGFLNCEGNVEESKSLMKNCFQRLMSCDGERVANACEKFLARCQTFTPSEKEEYLISIVGKLCSLFPKDVGAFCVYWLNHIVLSPGEALYLAPNEPHAYLHGDCVECMANSDNVVRAGLTPKFRDIDTLCEMLTYKNYHPSEIIFRPIAEDEFCQLFSPPVKDFAVAKITLPKNKKYRLRKRDSASILLILSGKGKLNSTDLELGKVLFIPSGEEHCIDSDELVLFQAFCSV